jgi:hypothetical protein
MEPDARLKPVGGFNVWRQMLCRAALLLLASGLGCQKPLQTVYGQRSGPGATESVCGTAVFGDMFERAGHRVSTWDSLSPRLDQADCIVWFPDDFRPPSIEVVRWLESWMLAKPHRTLIYVGRDFDAVSWYWTKVRPTAPLSQKQAIERAIARAQQEFQTARDKKPIDDGYCRWFRCRDLRGGVTASNVSGDMEWIQDVDPALLEIEVNSRIVPHWGMDPLLESDEGMLIGRSAFGQSQLLVVANGSFLLNVALVNHEHRKLAGKLIDSVGQPGRDVVFLESGQIKIDQPAGTSPAGGPSTDPFAPGSGQVSKQEEVPDNGPPIRPRDPQPQISNGMELFLTWPTNWILIHCVAVGIIFCFWKLPIFGLPRPADPTGAADFGRHIDAVAALFARTGDRRYALSRIRHYQQVIGSPRSPEKMATK